MIEIFNSNFPEFILEFSYSTMLLYIFCFLLIVVYTNLVVSRDLVKSIILISLSSIILCICYLLMDAPDVAMTEAALGACLSTAIFIKTMTPQQSDISVEGNFSSKFFSLLICIIFAAALINVMFHMPDFGSNDTALHQLLSNYYIENTVQDIGIPSFTTAILASYRGYDTLGEASVIFCAGISVILINKKSYAKKR